MSFPLIVSLRKRLRRLGHAVLILLIVLVPASRFLLASVIPNAAAKATNKAKGGTQPAASQPSRPSTPSPQTPRSTGEGD